jgi:hypothetical protein
MDKLIRELTHNQIIIELQRVAEDLREPRFRQRAGRSWAAFKRELVRRREYLNRELAARGLTHRL